MSASPLYTRWINTRRQKEQMVRGRVMGRGERGERGQAGTEQELGTRQKGRLGRHFL